jgi:hypothetical protein
LKQASRNSTRTNIVLTWSETEHTEAKSEHETASGLITSCPLHADSNARTLRNQRLYSSKAVADARGGTDQAATGILVAAK